MKMFCVFIFACLHVASAQKASGRGVKLKSQKAAVEFGVKGDVALRRHGAALKIDASFVQAKAFKVGDMTLAAYIEATVRQQIKPQIQHCKPGYKGSFCDKKCTNANLSKQMYTAGCTVACKKGFSLLKGKCTNVLGAPCKIKNSNKKPGKACQCLPFHGGKITWKGAVATGQCQPCGLVSGFNADMSATTVAATGWKELRNWRTNTNNELYENGNEFQNLNGRFVPKQTGYYLCNANVRMDQFNQGFSRLLIAINGKRDVNNGLHTIEGNGGSTNYRSMMISGTLRMTKGQYASVYVYSSKDNSYRISTESGFSCHQLDTNVGFHAEKNGNQKLTNRKWIQLTKWRTTGTLGVYNAGKGFDIKTSIYTSPVAGVHYCYAMVRFDKASKTGFIRLNLHLNGKPDVSNGFHAIRGNKGSSDYGSLNIAGTIYLKKGDKTALSVFSSVDGDFLAHTESGWGCHNLASNVGFHADAISNQKFGRYWSRVSRWRTAGNNELYAMGGAGVSNQGFFTAPYGGYYVCATQIRIDLSSTASAYAYVRVLLAVNGQIDTNNGMHSIDGNQGSTNYRTLRVAGIVRLDPGSKISVHVYNSYDASWTLNQESGFSCNRLKSRPPCPQCKIKNSNMKRGQDCACKTGFTGKVMWKGNVAGGTCKPAACKIKNSNMKSGPPCMCKNGYKGKIMWKGDKASGSCQAAPCWIPGSNNKPGPACKCKDLHSGKLTWKGAQVTGACNMCGANSGFNADLLATITMKKKSWVEVTKWRTNANNEMYETNQKEFDNAKGRFKPKKDGYYLCNANVRLDLFSRNSQARLLLAINGKKDANNGLQTVEGNGGSTNYRSMMLSGNLQIKKGQYVSVFVYSSSDNSYKIQGESGFSCHRFNSMDGFHADKAGDQQMRRGFVDITNFRASGTVGLYNVGGGPGGGFNGKTGRYTAPRGGIFFCTVMIRMDGASTTGYFRVNLVVNKQTDYSNGFHAIRGNKGSANYGSLNLAGTLNLQKGQFVSLVTYSSNDASWKIHSESGFGCHRMNTKIGFHADQTADQVFGNGWNRITNWRTTGNNELYAMGGARVLSGFFAAPAQGYYVCATQVRVQYASSIGNNYFRLLIAINNQMDLNNGMHTIDGNGGSTNYRSMRVAGTVYLRKGNRVSVNVYSRMDTSWRAQHESGFSCHMFETHVVACPKCNVANSNKIDGPQCKCLPGFKGTVQLNRSTKKLDGKCAKAKCTVKNSNGLDGAKCKCKSFFNGQVNWGPKGAMGSCRPCGAAKGFNADLTATSSAKAGWREISKWRTSGNNEMYESDGSFENGSGRFRPKLTGYYLCNANVRLDGFTNKGTSRLIIAVSGKKDKNNGLHTVEGDGGSTNYRSMMVSGTLQLKKTEYASVFVHSSGDNSYRIHSESGFSCQMLQSPYGFHAEKNGDMKMAKGWKEVSKWRVSGTAGLYTVGKGFDVNRGRFSAQMDGVYYCYAMVSMTGASTSTFRLSLNLNNGLDVNNGLHAVRGNKDSKNYGSSNVAGTLNLKKNQKVSVYVYAAADNTWKVSTESGWGCHRLGSNIGFHASGRIDQTFRNSWNRLKQWRTTGNNELYNIGGPGINTQGFYQVPSDGYYACAAQIRIDNTNSGYFRVVISINGGIDINNGMHAIDGNFGSNNMRSMRVAGTVALKTGNTVSVYVFSQNDFDWKVSKQSGFSCGKTYAKQPCPVCNIPNSNKVRGQKCACKTGFTGKITWKINKPSGKCTPVKCTVANSNKKPGPACACGNGFSGKITWKNNKPSGKCTIAPCKVTNSNKQAGPKCKCNTNQGYRGTIRWMGPTAIGPCSKCGTNSGFNADLTKNILARSGWTEIKNWRTNANSELYESNGEFNNGQGRFAPKASGYYLCNANVALDGFSRFGYSRLIISVNGKRDVNNGLHTIEGNGGSTNYRSMVAAGTVQIKKGQYISVLVFSSNDNSYYIKSESGFSCHRFSTNVGFHADKFGTQSMKAGWGEIKNWRVTGPIGLYNVGGGYNRNSGRYTAPKTGAYFCGAMIRLDGASQLSYFRVNINLNNQADVNNGFHVIRGNKGSFNYGSLNVAGSIYLTKGNIVSVYSFSRSDNFYNVQTESGWGCHMMGTGVGFHADLSTSINYKAGWSRVTKWRTAGNNELYASGGGPNSQGYYSAPETGYYMCATQVRVDKVLTSLSTSSRFRLIIAINGQIDIHNGLHVNDGNQGSTNFRSLRVAGTVFLKKGVRTSVNVYTVDKAWTLQSESGFSCHMFVTKEKCGSKPQKTTLPNRDSSGGGQTTIMNPGGGMGGGGGPGGGPNMGGRSRV